MSRMIDKNSGASETEASKTAESESVFRRWSRRKQEARLAERRDVASPDPAPASNVERSDATPERVLTDADMPPLETLDEKSDYSPFMSPGVSDGLRRAALRRLFCSPELNHLCELEGEFYDTFGLTPLGSIVTYDMRAALERELEQAKSSAKEKLRSELTDEEESKSAAEAPDARPEFPDRAEADAEIVAARPDEKPSNNRGAT